MYKVLIAEDEILVRLGLANSISWEKLGMVLVAQAANGVQAYELFLQEQPDIVITDIRMPLMDGMELIRRIRETDNSCQIIIITCVEEFEYARQAISWQVKDYILKLTMNIEDIESILATIRSTLDASQAEGTHSQFSKSADPAIRQELYDCLCGYAPTFSHNPLTAPFFGDGFQIAYIQIILSEKGMTPENNRSKVCLDKTMFQLLKHQMEHGPVSTGTGTSLLIEKIPGEYFLLFQNFDSFKSDFEGLTVLTRTYYNSRPVCGVSPPVYQPEEAAKAAHCASECLSQYFFHPEANLFDMNTQSDDETIRKTVAANLEDIFTETITAHPCLEEFWQEYANSVLLFLADSPADNEHIQKLFYKLAGWLLEKLSLNSSEPAVNCVYNYRRYIFSADNIQDIYYIFRQLLHKLLSLQDSSDSLSREMTKIVRFIEQHYAENLTLEQLSSYVHYSKGYVCNLFRKELNTSFGSYLANIRINHAKLLLRSSFLKLYEVAEQTGFYDYSHFVKTFRKITGLSPQEYQNHQGDSL